MILMSKYKGQHGGKTGSKNSGRGLPPPFSGNARKKTFFLREGFPYGALYFDTASKYRALQCKSIAKQSTKLKSVS